MTYVEKTQQKIIHVKHQLQLLDCYDTDAGKRPLWEDESNFKDEWATLVQDHQKSLISVGIITKKQIKPWFEYLPNADKPELSRFRCRICHLHYDRLKLDHHLKPSLAKAEGVLKPNNRLNNDIINNHVGRNGVQHAQVISKLKLEYLHYLEQKLKSKNSGIHLT